MVVRVGIEFITGPAAAATKRLQGTVAGLQNAFNKLTGSSDKAGRKIKQFSKEGSINIGELEEKTNKLNRSMNSLGSVVGKVAIGFAALQTVQAGIARDESERRLRLLTQAFGETEQAQDAARRAAEKFNLSQTEANVQLSRLIARLRPMGLSMQTIETAFAGFNTATILAGATASESAGAFLQLSQALGSGVLRGQELNSILEQAPLIAQAIATEMGTTVGALKKFGEEGKITSEIVIAALGRVEREGAGQLEEALKGPAAAIKDFQNAVEDVQVALTGSVMPQLSESFRGLAELIVNLEGPINFIGDLAANALNQINSLIVQATQPAKAAARRDIEAGIIPTNFVNFFKGQSVRGGAEELFGEAEFKELEDKARQFAKLRGQSFQEVLLQFLQDRLKTMDEATRARLDRPGLDRPQFRIEPDGDSKLAERTQRQLATSEKKLFLSKAELAIAKESSDLAKIDLKFDLQKGKLQRDYNSLISKALSDEERSNLKVALRSELEALSLERNKAISGHMRDQFDALSKVTAEMQEMAPFTKELSKEFQSLANTINNEILSGIEGMIEGTKTLGQVASSMLKKIASQMLQTAIMGPQGSGGIAGMLFGALGIGGGGGFKAPQVKTAGLDFSGAFAGGGRPPVGKAALVGERGPELFVPRSSGTIVPNNAMGGSTNVVVNVDAKGTATQGDDAQAGQLGRLIGAAVQAELIKQKRPGGLLTS